MEWKEMAVDQRILILESGYSKGALPIILSPLFLCVLETFHNKKLM